MGPEQWRQIEDIYHRALELTGEVRVAYLDEACGQDTGLRQQVESLLAQVDQAEQFLESRAQATVTLAMDQRIGSFRILSPLGAGGMGVVHRAHDDRLGRDVAIKTLPAEFVLDTERLARFRREARTLASLNHTNIASIYSLEETSGSPHLVMELVEGETLHGALPIDKALDYSRQVALALEAAHEKGIIHRDLKPSNVKITGKGVVKVLDFGLAKAVWGTEQDQDLSQLQTVTELQTVAGRIVGTPPYMSPEQARGLPVDTRTDIWAFGCLLFELLTGKRAFEGRTLHETIASVLEGQPDWNALPKRTPARIRELLRKCLQKDTGRRVSRIEEARLVIEACQRRPRRWPLIAAGVAILGLTFGWTLWVRKSSSASDPSRWVQITRLPDSVTQPAFSPDGRMLAFLRGANTFIGSADLYVKILPDGEPVQLTHDHSRKMSPVFSPDGSRIAYTALGDNFGWNTWIIPVLGGKPELWLPNTAALTWVNPQEVLYSTLKTGLHMSIAAAPESRVSSRDVYVPPIQLGMAHKSYLSPDHKSVLIVEMDEKNWLPCRLVPFDGASPGRQVGPPSTCTSAAWSPDGKWMYFSAVASGDRFHIWRQRFPDGKPEQLTSGLNQEEGIAVSPDGRSLITAVASRQRPVWFHDASGDRQISLEAYGRQPAFYAAGRKVYYIGKIGDMPSRNGGTLWAGDLETGHNEPVFPSLNVINLDITEDGRLLAGVLDSAGIPRVWLASLDQRTPPKEIPGVVADWAFLGPPGTVFIQSRQEGSQDTTEFLFRMHEDGSLREQIGREPITELHSVSADGNWVTAMGPHSEKEAGISEYAYSTTGQARTHICEPPCRAFFAHDGKSIYFEISEGFMSGAANGRTYVLPAQPGSMFPKVPDAGFKSEAEIAAYPGVRTIEAADVRPGPTSGVYAFSREVVQRNLYRIPLP